MDLSSAKKKYRTASATAEPLSAPGLLQKVRMPRQIGAGPLFHAQAAHPTNSSTRFIPPREKTNAVGRKATLAHAEKLGSVADARRALRF